MEQYDIYLEPQTTIYKWLFQLDDSKPLHRKWLFHQTSIYKWLFRVPGIYTYPIYEKSITHFHIAMTFSDFSHCHGRLSVEFSDQFKFGTSGHLPSKYHFITLFKQYHFLTTVQTGW